MERRTRELDPETGYKVMCVCTDYYFKLRLSFPPPRSVSVSSAKTRTVSESSLRSSTYSGTDNSL